MKTRDKVAALALYASECCGEELLFDVHEYFSRCPCCERPTSWKFVERVLSWQELDGPEEQAA
jgi:hypothetical protein